MNEGAKEEISPKSRITKKLIYSAKHQDYSDRSYYKIKRTFHAKQEKKMGKLEQ